MNRRDFLATVPLALAASTLPASEIIAPPAASNKDQNSSAAAQNKTSAPSAAHDLDFATALEAAEAIRTKKISSVELTERMFARIDHYNPQLNIFAYQLRPKLVSSESQSSRRTKTAAALACSSAIPALPVSGAQLDVQREHPFLRTDRGNLP